jgi:hypothetical protein
MISLPKKSVGQRVKGKYGPRQQEEEGCGGGRLFRWQFREIFAI